MREEVTGMSSTSLISKPCDIELVGGTVQAAKALALASRSVSFLDTPAIFGSDLTARITVAQNIPTNLLLLGSLFSGELALGADLVSELSHLSAQIVKGSGNDPVGVLFSEAWQCPGPIIGPATVPMVGDPTSDLNSPQSDTGELGLEITLNACALPAFSAFPATAHLTGDLVLLYCSMEK